MIAIKFGMKLDNVKNFFGKNIEINLRFNMAV